MSQYVIVTAGHGGDIFPLLKIGLQLMQQGHSVTMLSQNTIKQMITDMGIAFVSVLDANQSAATLTDPKSSDQASDFDVITTYLLAPTIDPVFDYVANHRQEDLRMIAPPWFFGARLAHEAFGIPLTMVHFAPVWSNSMNGFTQQIVEQATLDLVKEARRQRGLTSPVTSVFDWLADPAVKVLGLFPEWFGTIDPNWICHCQPSEFPLGRVPARIVLPDDVEAFIEAGEPPFIFTPGTHTGGIREFFEHAINVSEHFKRRAIFLCQHRDHMPDVLPPTVLHLEFFPLQYLLPKAELFVYHGGIGSCAEAMRAGVPQLILPHSYDQFDNAARIERLGIGKSLLPEQVSIDGTVASIEELLISESIQHACAGVMDRFEGVDGVQLIGRSLVA